MSINETASPDQPLVETYPGPFEEQPSQPPWPAKGPADSLLGVFWAGLVWILSVVFLIFVPLITVIPYLAYKQIAFGTVGDIKTDPNVIFVSILGVVPAHLLTLLLVWFVVTSRGQRPFWSTLGWYWPRNFRPLKTIGLAVVLLVVGWVITSAIGGAETQMDQIINSSLKTRFATAFLAAITGPLIEELVYRGVLYAAIERTLGMKAAVAIVSALFAGVHVAQYYNNLGVIAVISFLSVSLTLVRARSGSLLPSYVMHLVFNSIQAIILVLQPFVGKPATENPTASGFVIHTLAQLFS